MEIKSAVISGILSFIFIFIMTGFVGLIGLVGIFIGIMAAMMFYFIDKFYTSFEYPVKVIMLEQRGESLIWDTDDRAKPIKTKEGYEYYRLMNKRDNIKPPEYARLGIDRRGKTVMPLFTVSRGLYFPISKRKDLNGRKHA